MLLSIYDNRPIIEEYNKALPVNTSIEYSDVNGLCVTKLYEYPAKTSRQTYVMEGQNKNSRGVMRIYKDGKMINWWGQAEKRRTCIDANSNGIRVTLLMNQLDSCYLYLEETGQILFAGKQSIYYGHKNISELE